jgi:hypothetical protein
VSPEVPVLQDATLPDIDEPLERAGVARRRIARMRSADIVA